MQCFAQEATPLAVSAARKALDEAGFAPESITHLVSVSCTGFFAPGVDVALIKQLGLPPTIQRTQVGFMGCHGAVNGLRVAQAHVDASAEARVLLCAVELCTLHLYYEWDPMRNVANALFADGAAALACVPGAGGREDSWRVAATGSCLFPDSEDAMRWEIGDHGFDMLLSPRIPMLIAHGLRPWLEGWLAQHKLRLEEIGSWAVHPGGPRILSAVEETLGLPREALADSRGVLADYGNMSSPTVLFILDRLRQRQARRPCVVLGFGPGLIVEAALVM
jgi:predicted naringenin-chalcone synthase